MNGSQVAIAAGLGVLAALLFPLISWITTGTALKGLLIGADGKLSTSKCQFWIWTEVVLFAYVFLFTCHFQGGKGWPGAGPTVPTDVLILMGLSVVTATTAKGIASSQPGAAMRADATLKAAASARTGGAVPPVQAAHFRDLVTDDQNAVTSSFSKIQTLTWNAVAACVYVVTAIVARDMFFAGSATSYPDVDAALVVLVGLGQGAYLGNKIAAKGGTDV